jgi:hypothetical protein
MGVHSASACIVLLGLLVTGCGSSFTASEEDGSARDVGTSDAPKSDSSAPTDTGPGDAPAGSFKCGPTSCPMGDFCVVNDTETVGGCIPTPKDCDKKVTCDCDEQSISGSYSCDLCTGRPGEFVLHCSQGVESDAAPPADASMPPQDAGKPKDGGIKLPLDAKVLDHSL